MGGEFFGGPLCITGFLIRNRGLGQFSGSYITAYSVLDGLTSSFSDSSDEKKPEGWTVLIWKIQTSLHYVKPIYAYFSFVNDSSILHNVYKKN